MTDPFLKKPACFRVRQLIFMIALTTNFFLNWDSLHVRLNSNYAAWSYKKTKHKKVKAYRKSVYKEPTVKRSLLILDLKPFRL